MSQSYREGDVIVLHATVRFDVEPNANAIHVKIHGDFEHHPFRIIKLDNVVGVHFRKWNTGDPVWLDGDESCGTVIATCGDVVWVKAENGGNFLVESNSLKLDERQPKEAEEASS